MLSGKQDTIRMMHGSGSEMCQSGTDLFRLATFMQKRAFATTFHWKQWGE